MGKIDFAKHNRRENKFIERDAPELGLRAMINPLKSTDPYAPDLLVEGEIADLKVQTKPFFMASKLHKIDPQYCWTFSERQYRHYAKNYPNMEIYICIEYCTKDVVRVMKSGETIKVRPMKAIYRVNMRKIIELVDSMKAPLHVYTYGDRAGESVYCFDVRGFTVLKLKLSGEV